jgi:hypothetical protein
VNATGRVQNVDFNYDLIKEVVVEEVGLEFVVQIVTDNGSNYKKACKQLTDEYKHITWQPCAAHTINLMLKDITRQFEVEAVVVCAKRICNFLYSHNRLHAMMREKIGGELIRWNATRFGTVFLFLQSFMDKREKFEAWMISSDWKNSDFKDEEDHEFTTDCLMSSGLFGWLVADGWCWFVLREEYCWLVAGGWFVLREKYCWLVADKPSEQGVGSGGRMWRWS